MERSLALSIIYQRRTLLAVSSHGLSISYCLDCLIIKIVLFTSLMCLLHRYVKIPWSKFILGSRGRIQDKQSVVPLEVIMIIFIMIQIGIIISWCRSMYCYYIIRQGWWACPSPSWTAILVPSTWRSRTSGSIMTQLPTMNNLPTRCTSFQIFGRATKVWYTRMNG